MSPSERLILLHDLNQREQRAMAKRQSSDLLAIVGLGAFLGALFIWVAIFGGKP
jgi:hypothetical protein